MPNTRIINSSIGIGDVYYKVYTRLLIQLTMRVVSLYRNIFTTPDRIDFWGHTIILYRKNESISTINKYSIDYLPVSDKKTKKKIDRIFELLRRYYTYE